MDVIGAVVGYGMAIFLGVLATIVLGILALLGRNRVIGATFLLSLIGTVGLLAWPAINRAINPSRFPSPVEITRYGTGELTLDMAREDATSPRMTECRRSQSAYLFRTVTMADAGRLHGARLRVTVMLHPEDVLVIVAATTVSGELDRSWSGEGRLARGDEFGGQVIFEHLTSIGEPGDWPGELNGQIGWSCGAELKPPVEPSD